MQPGKVLEVGSKSRKAQFRHLWQRHGWAVTGCDLSPGPNVDVVLEDPFDFPWPDGSFDAAISGQMLEHNSMFWLTFIELNRVLRIGGFMVHIAPSRGPEHKAPTDCWRFYRDGFQALADWSGFEILDARTDWSQSDIALVGARNPGAAKRMQKSAAAQTTLWGDTVGVFRKTTPTHETEAMRYIRRFSARNTAKPQIAAE